jgi:hypothetical protein
VTFWVSFISFLALHFTQYPVSAISLHLPSKNEIIISKFVQLYTIKAACVKGNRYLYRLRSMI